MRWAELNWAPDRGNADTPSPGAGPPRASPIQHPQAAFLSLRSRFWKTWETLLHKDTAIHPNAMKHRQNKGY